MKVMGRWSVKTVDVRADGTGLSSRAGTSLLALVADRVGLTGECCDYSDMAPEHAPQDTAILASFPNRRAAEHGGFTRSDFRRTALKGRASALVVSANPDGSLKEQNDP